MKTKLYIEKSRNISGYRLYSPVVVEGIFSGTFIKVSAPEIFDEATYLIPDEWQEVSEDAGHPRIPTSKETNGDSNNWCDEMISKFGVE